ncbi:MAG: diaminopimelate epimerase [Acidimicrobiia bacterium]|nr:diaminopimelate epimerase [Acidimicrobiia bacterium]
MTVARHKYQALGNDFLILVDPDGTHAVDDEFVRRVCDRHLGVGADGLITVTPGAAGRADLVMDLRNADGGRAEMSGNGIRCLVRAAVSHGLVAGPEVTVATDHGDKRLWVKDEGVTVDMGPGLLGPERDHSSPGWRQMEVDMGNPHLVLLCPDPAEVHVAELGPKLEQLRPGGLNVEFIAPGPGTDELRFRVWERGAGETQACGTGSCAAAAAAHAWGLVGTTVTVHNPGGDLDVEVGEDTMLLTGPAEYVARVEIPS